jgi:hypothetical protein
VVPNPHELAQQKNDDLSPEALEQRTLANQAKVCLFCDTFQYNKIPYEKI